MYSLSILYDIHTIICNKIFLIIKFLLMNKLYKEDKTF